MVEYGLGVWGCGRVCSLCICLYSHMHNQHTLAIINQGCEPTHPVLEQYTCVGVVRKSEVQ